MPDLDDTDVYFWTGCPILSPQQARLLVELAPVTGYPCSCGHSPADHDVRCLGGLQAMSTGGYHGIAVCICRSYEPLDLEEYE